LTGRTDKERVLYTKSVVDLLETKLIMDNEDEMCLSEDAEQTQMGEEVRSIETCKGVSRHYTSFNYTRADE
jgi:hypothetical protein